MCVLRTACLIELELRGTHIIQGEIKLLLIKLLVIMLFERLSGLRIVSAKIRYKIRLNVPLFIPLIAISGWRYSIIESFASINYQAKRNIYSTTIRNTAKNSVRILWNIYMKMQDYQIEYFWKIYNMNIKKCGMPINGTEFEIVIKRYTM